MRSRHAATPLPRDWKSKPVPGILLERDIKVRPSSRVYAKLLVFENRADLRRFWTEDLGKEELGEGCCGAVHPLWRTVDEGRIQEFDPRYFCVIGLIKDYLSMEIICHESVHAGYAYAERCRGVKWPGCGELEEEYLAYPTGAISAGINFAVSKAGLY